MMENKPVKRCIPSDFYKTYFLQKPSPVFYIFLFFLFSLAFPFNSHSQDVIVRTTNDSIRCKVIEITTDKIRFRYNNLKDSPIQEIHKNSVKQIIYENGSKLNIVYNRYEVPADMIIREKKHSIKVDLFAPLFNHFTAGYEMKLKLGTNLEIKCAIIGSNISTFLKHSEGFFIKGGVKFIRLSNSYSKGLKYINPLKGSYFKPGFIFSQYKRDEDHTYVYHTHYAIDIVFGRQYSISKRIVLDYFGGAGFGIEKTSSIDDLSYAYSHIFFGEKIPIIITGGLTMGYVF
jgi:hypothetical protein